MLGGLVGFNTSTGTVQNSTVTDTAINGNIATAGGLVGINSGQITGSSPGQVSANTTITLNGANSIGGGLVGTNNASGAINNASASGSLNWVAGSEGLLMNFGGLVGWNLGGIQNSTASAVVNGGSGTAGGLVGKNEGSISASTASGNVSGTGAPFQFAWLGGLVGDNEAGATITKSPYPRHRHREHRRLREHRRADRQQQRQPVEPQRRQYGDSDRQLRVGRRACRN